MTGFLAVVLGFLSTSSVLLVTAKRLMLLQESHEQTFAYALEKIPTTAIENHVLDILELEEPPPVLTTRRKRDDKITTFMSELYRELEDDIEGEISSQGSGIEEWSSADRIVSLSPKETKFSNGYVAVTFDCDDLPSNGASHLIASQLRIFLPEEDMPFAKISVYHNKTGTLALVDSTIATSQQKTAGFNITQMVSDWILGLNEPKLFIRIESGEDLYYVSDKELESFVIASFLDENTHIPFRTTRIRRDVGPIQEINITDRKTTRMNTFSGGSGGELEGCHVQSLYLNFADIGWREWVIAPEGYSTNYCAGACSSDSPMHNKMNATNHAIVQTLVHLVDPKRAEEAKCAPIQLSPAKILFIDNHGNVVMRRYQDMTVQECGCL
ncbi:hypothetical protein KIN20_005343 [Parelaphostrongylus tenuis]|uniref:TGF-beta family profile domain-containing protein n=1 Tax=Parelaphostrongylus tenuis TaxID=148309 RepID=A0AAD5MIQ3_PARTN|nr:hypothetical protein KIN20_005343 [Parelaphostrongylus tenuis]